MRLAFLLALALQGSPADRWFAPDKLKHFLLAAFVQSVGYSALRATSLGHHSSLVGASAGTALLSVGKELADRRGTGFSTRDLVWDAAGAGASTILLDRIERVSAAPSRIPDLAPVDSQLSLFAAAVNLPHPASVAANPLSQPPSGPIFQRWPLRYPARHPSPS